LEAHGAVADQALLANPDDTAFRPGRRRRGTDKTNVGLSGVEVYNPIRGRWTTTDNLNSARIGHTATLLPDGTVLVAGGDNAQRGLLKSAELGHFSSAP